MAQLGDFNRKQQIKILPVAGYLLPHKSEMQSENKYRQQSHIQLQSHPGTGNRRNPRGYAATAAQMMPVPLRLCPSPGRLTFVCSMSNQLEPPWWQLRISHDGWLRLQPSPGLTRKEQQRSSKRFPACLSLLGSLAPGTVSPKHQRSCGSPSPRPAPAQKAFPSDWEGKAWATDSGPKLQDQ